jgi:hypothetical protein
MARLLICLPGPLLWACCGEAERAVELYALISCVPIVSYWRWIEDVAGRHIAAAAASLSPDVVAAAEARGRVRDMNATVAEILAEFGGGDHE